jgi:type II secretory ATPase GspE/PulE/Tfp pilus assembly ATPase PilB-like protein
VLEIVKNVIEEPYGFVIFTGPTNSGKTTLIHSIIKEISKRGINVMTLEEPVEYRVPGITQTNVSESFSFLEGMKSILRQDPSVIFLGEIRDEKTAQIAAQAAMIGHKIFTTLHAYSAKGAISRLIDMHVSLKILAESLLAIFSQRLVRRFDGEKYNGLALVSDAVLFNEEIRDQLRADIIPNFSNKLYDNGLILVEKNITTIEEIKRVIGNKRQQ